MNLQTPLLISLFFISSCTKFFGGSDKPVVATCETPNVNRSCPKIEGEVFLPRTFPARAIYIGYSSDLIHEEFLDLVLAEVKNHKVKPTVNILIPRTESLDAYEKLSKYFNNKDYSFLNLIPTTADVTVWAQDYLEILFNPKTGMSKIVDLPYAGRDGEDIPTSVALSCQKELVKQREFTSENMPGNGDYGGNIEAITTGVVMVGNNLSNETYEIIQNNISQELVDIDVSWLETGHVDELVTTLPHSENAGPCDQSLLVASPSTAYQILDKLPRTTPEYKTKFEPYYDDINDWPDLHSCLNPKNFIKSECVELKKANTAYQTSIDKSVKAIQEKIEKVHGCTLKVKSFPQLFVPLKNKKVYATVFDRAIALNPNSVNNIYFFPSLILAKQEFQPFQDEVEKVLKSFPYKVIYANGKFVHELNGGVHCATNIAYGCKP